MKPWTFFLAAVAGWTNRRQHGVVEQYVEDYNKERPHEGIWNRRVNEAEHQPPRAEPVACRERLDDLLKSYHR